MHKTQENTQSIPHCGIEVLPHNKQSTPAAKKDREKINLKIPFFYIAPFVFNFIPHMMFLFRGFDRTAKIYTKSAL